MKAQIATGFIPYEIGDRVKLYRDDHNVYIVKEMRMIQYIAARKVEFELQLCIENGDTLIWRKPNKIKERIL